MWFNGTITNMHKTKYWILLQNQLKKLTPFYQNKSVSSRTVDTFSLDTTELKPLTTQGRSLLSSVSSNRLHSTDDTERSTISNFEDGNFLAYSSSNTSLSASISSLQLPAPAISNPRQFFIENDDFEGLNLSFRVKVRKIKNLFPWYRQLGSTT